MFQKRLDHERYASQRIRLERQTTSLTLGHPRSCQHGGLRGEFCHLLYGHLCLHVWLQFRLCPLSLVCG